MQIYHSKHVQFSHHLLDALHILFHLSCAFKKLKKIFHIIIPLKCFKGYHCAAKQRIRSYSLDIKMLSPIHNLTFIAFRFSFCCVLLIIVISSCIKLLLKSYMEIQHFHDGNNVGGQDVVVSHLLCGFVVVHFKYMQ